MIFTDYDGNRLGDSDGPPDWEVWIAEASYDLDGETATYCRDGRIELVPDTAEPVPTPDYVTTADLADALADAAEAVSSAAEDLAGINDAIAELSALVSELSEKGASNG